MTLRQLANVLNVATVPVYINARVFYVKADFHSVQNVARSIFSERFLLKCVKSTTANEICSA